MGLASRLNPRSAQGKPDEEEFALARLRQVVESMSRLQFGRWLLSFPPAPGLSLEETRQQIRQQLQPFARFTVEARRADREHREARQRLIKDRALLVAQKALEGDR